MISSEYDRRYPPIRYSWIGESFDLFSRDAGAWVCAVFIAGSAQLLINATFSGRFIFQVLPRALSGHPVSYYEDTPVALPHVLLLFLVSGYFYCGLFGMGARAVSGERVYLRDLFSGLPNLANFYAYSAAIVVLSILGILLSGCICGLGVLYVLVAMWPGFALAATGVDAGRAISRSYQLVHEHPFTGWLFALLCGILFSVSMIPALLGLLVTVPMLCITASLMVRDLAPQQAITVEVTPIIDGSWPPRPTEHPAQSDIIKNVDDNAQAKDGE